jgi:hypothetical protein
MSGAEPSGDVAPPEPPPDVPGPAVPRAGADAGRDDTEIGWARAIASGLAILLVGFGGAVVGANSILTKALGLRRTPREWLATGLFFFVVVVLAWVLRRLQDRKLI